MFSYILCRVLFLFTKLHLVLLCNINFFCFTVLKLCFVSFISSFHQCCGAGQFLSMFLQEQHNLCGGRAVMNCGSGSGSLSSKCDVQNGEFSKNCTNWIILLFFSIHIYNNFHYTESGEKWMSDIIKKTFRLVLRNNGICFASSFAKYETKQVLLETLITSP
jgi:hypothetical protein